MKMVRFTLTSLTTAEEIPGYMDANEIFAWHVWNIGDDIPPGGNIHRKLRGKTLVVLNTKPGAIQWTQESFDEVSAKILEARGQAGDAKTHKELAEGARVEKSRFTV
jgi:hypothetical protein